MQGPRYYIFICPEELSSESSSIFNTQLGPLKVLLFLAALQRCWPGWLAPEKACGFMELQDASLSYLLTLERCWAGHQKTWMPGKPHQGSDQEPNQKPRATSSGSSRRTTALLWSREGEDHPPFHPDIPQKVTYFTGLYLWFVPFSHYPQLACMY